MRPGSKCKEERQEPLNVRDVPGYCVPDLEQAVAILDATAGHVTLQFDIYHAAQMEIDPESTFLALKARISHVQIADVPGRHEPGTGDLPIMRILRTIDASNYSGWVGAEYHPLASSASSISWLGAFDPSTIRR